VDGLWATKSESIRLILSVQLVSKISNLCGATYVVLSDPPTSQTDGRTDGQRDRLQNTDRRHAIARPGFAL